MPEWRISRSTLAAIYLRALRNEIAIDMDSYKAIGAAPDEFAFLPRFSAVWPLLSRNRRASSMAARLLRMAWRYGLYVPFFARQYLSLRQTPHARSDGTDQTLHVLLSALAPQLVANADGTDALAFTVPWQRYVNGIPHDRQVSIGDVLTRREMKDCLIDAIAIARRIANRNTVFADWHLQSYTLFRWVCVARALESIECRQMVMANHYDRWAILIDRIGGASGRRTAIAQHGIEAVRHLPTRLQFIDTIHVFNRQEEALFKQFILAPTIADSVNVRFLDNSIELAELDGNPDTVRVVIVGHPEYDATQLRFLEAARSVRPDVEFIYKPHPTARSVNSDIGAATVLWDRQGVFPRCEFVFSYQSTLGYQYRDAGVPTYLHDKDMSDDQIREAVGLIPRSTVKNVADCTNP